MTDLEQLKQNLVDAKNELEAKGYKLGEEGDFIDLVPDMKQYEYKFQDAIEQVWPDKAWWQMTNYWDMFQDSIMTGKTADEVIEDIMNHIVVKEEPEEVKKEQEIKEDKEDTEVEISDNLISLFDSKGE